MMNKEKIEKERELEAELAERSRKSLELSSKQDYGTSEATSVKMKDKEEKEFKTPGENYEKNADRIQISSGGKSEAMKRFEEKKERLKDKTEAKMKEMSQSQSKSLGKVR